MRRRTLLRAGIVGLVVGLSGCGSDGEGDGASPTSSPTDDTTPTMEATSTATETSTSDPDQVVQVAPDGDLSFSPESFTIETGETVEWRWDAGGHNVRPDSVPGDSSWSGTDGGDGETYGSDHTYGHTFTVSGTYEYYCAPHRNVGMTGSFTVE